MKGRQYLGFAAAVAPCACAEVDVAPPQVLEARFVAGDQVELTMSEEVAVDPLMRPSKFRLSARFEVDPELSIYFDVGEHFEAITPWALERGLPERWLRHAGVKVAEVSTEPDDDGRLRLQLSTAIEADVCEGIEASRAAGVDAGLFVHYSHSDAPRVVDLAGNALEDIGARWTHEVWAWEAEGELAELSPRIELDCAQALAAASQTP